MTQLIVAVNMNPSNGFVPTDDESLEAGTHVMVRQMTNHEWVVLAVPVQHNHHEIESVNLGAVGGPSGAEHIRRVFRTALQHNPLRIALFLEGSKTLSELEPVLVNCFGSDAFVVETTSSPVPFPIHGY